MYADLREWLRQVEELGELHRVTVPVDWDLEMGAVTYMVASREDAPALLFENVRDYPPGPRVLFNMLGSSRRRVALGLGLDPDLSPTGLIRATRERLKKRLPPRTVEEGSAPVKENVLRGEAIDLLKFPVPRMWPLDGGRYLGTADVVITRDPDDGTVNLGTYRQMVQGAREVGFYSSPGKDVVLHREKYWRKGQPCPVAAVYGVDPLLFMVGSQGFPKNVSEYDAAGGLRGEPVEVVTGEVTGLPIPARAEIGIEGFAYPGETRLEGPFGEFTGYYGRPEAQTPFIRVEALYHRHNPILTAALMADYPACEQNLFFSIIRSARIWDDLDTLGVPGIRGVYSHPAAAGGFGMVIVSLEQRYAGHAPQALALAAQSPGAAYYTKWIIAVDEDVDPTDINQVIWALSTRCNPVDDIDILRNTWSTWLDPTRNPPEERPYGSKALINACKEHKYLSIFSKRSRLTESTYRQVAARWQELGLPGQPPVLESFSG